MQCGKGASTITANGQTIKSSYGENPTKVAVSDNLMLQIQLADGHAEADS